MNKVKLTYHGRILSKKNSKRIVQKHGKPIVVSNKAAKANEDSMIEQFSIQTLSQTEPIEKCRVLVEIYESDWQERDLDNQLTSILDALEKADVIASDSIRCVLEINAKYMGVDEKDPRAEIVIEPIV